MIDRSTWTPPAALSSTGPDIRGVLYGSRLFDQPRHRPVRDSIVGFLADPAPAALEIGFDHGMRLLDQARRAPGWRWLGCEIREARALAVASNAPPNCMAVRADGRALLAGVIPAGRLSLCTILFPTPATDPRHLLLTPALVGLIGRALGPGGAVHLETDVPGMAAWIRRCFEGWAEAGPDHPIRAAACPEGLALSRRQRVCRRDGLPVWSFWLSAPSVLSLAA